MSESIRDAKELLEDAENYLDITWSDEGTDKKVTGILTRGIAYLDHVAGLELDYAEGNAARQLLFDYVRYVRSDAFHDYAVDYGPELLSLHISGEVTQNGNTSAQ
ncbi:MAG: hypothetical protein LKJ50_04670 [Clostridiales bacterium]|nr:hypothetical protein [Clostridiales bacterium]MCI1961233.1 hypothetical protein [Clostridiales bacterium]MCI2021674.1 hypothetical protein [Clostridiales bacterium]MCI2026460.1 hypothetical protein [Clostridiales bacterium]